MKSISNSLWTLILLVLCGVSSVYANLDKRYIGGKIEIKGRENQKFVTTRVDNPTLPVSGFFGGLDNSDSNWAIEKVPGESNTYRIKQVSSGLYLYVISSSGNINEAALSTTLAAWSGDDNQKFTFVSQVSASNRYKIRTAYQRSSDSRYYVLGFPKNNTADGLGLDVQLNVLTGFEQHQQFDISFVGDQSGKADYQSGNLLLIKKDSWTSAWHLRSNADKIVWNIDANGYLAQQLSTGGIDYSNNSIFTMVQDPNTPDPGNDLGGIMGFRIQHKESKKYLTLEGDYTSLSTGTKIKLEDFISVDSAAYKRQIFYLRESPRLISRWGMGLYSATGTFSEFYFLEPDADGFIKLHYRNLSDNLGDEWRRMEISHVLSVPNKGVTEPFFIMNKSSGHVMSDNGLNQNEAEVTHNDVSNYASVWHFEQQANGFYLIKNALTGNYMTTRYGGNLGSIVKTTVDKDVSGNHNLWSVQKDEGRYYLQSVATSFFMVTNNVASPESPIKLGGSIAGGSKWVIMPILQDEIQMTPGTYNKIMDSKTINFIHPGNNLTARDAVLRMIGLPGDPINHINNSLQVNWSNLGVNTTASFYTVLKSAISSYYNGSIDPEVLLADYFDDNDVGNRVELAFILRKYILEDLITKGRANWTFNETELVTYLERRIGDLRSDYAQRIEDSWNAHKAAQNPGNPPLLSDLISFTSEDGYEVPDEIIFNEDEYVNQLQYQHVAQYNEFKNPNTYLQTIFTQASVVGAHVLFSHIGASTFINTIASKAGAAAVAASDEVAEEILTLVFRQGVNKTWRSFRFFQSFGMAANIGSVVSMSLEILIKQSMDVAEFINFEGRILSKVAKLRQAVDIPGIQNATNELDKMSMYQYMDYIFGNSYNGAVERFPTTLTAPRLYVGKGLVGTSHYNSGTTWSEPLLNLTDALAMAEKYGINEIWLAGNENLNINGSNSTIFYPDEGRTATDNDRNSTFDMPNGIKIYGGFNGTESTLAERNIAVNRVILSGEIQQNGTDNDNAYTVVSVTKGNAVLDGLEITGGKANGAVGVASNIQNSGGGIYIRAENSANTQDRVEIQNCKIHKNTASRGAGGIDYGGEKPLLLILNSNLITQNTGNYGGGIHFDQSLNVNNTSTHKLYIFHSTVTGNSANLSSYGCNLDIQLQNQVFAQYFSQETAELFASNSIISLHEPTRSPSQKSIVFKQNTTGRIIAHLNNVCLGETQNFAFPLNGSQNVYLVDPMFKRPTGGSRSYELSYNSPLKNQGDIAYGSGFEFDFNNEKRVVGNNVDIGVYEIQSPCTIGELVSLTMSPPQNNAINSYRASNSITSAQAFITDAHTEIIAGRSVNLLPGFKAEAGSVATIAIEDCN